MDVEKLAQYDGNRGLLALEAILKADEQNKTILSSKELSARLVETEQWKIEKDVYPAWSGTFFAHMAKDESFPAILEKNSFKVNIPKKWQGLKNKVILCNHPDFETKKDGTITFGKSATIYDMPAQDGWYDANNEFEFPTGEKKDYSNARRCLWRRENSLCGLVSRGGLFGGVVRRFVDCGGDGIGRLGVLVNDRAKRGKSSIKQSVEEKLTLLELKNENDILKAKLEKIKKILESE